MNQAVLTGMVLSSSPAGEYDRRVVLLTRERGRFSAFARGARRPNSPLRGAVNPFSFGEFTVYEGRSSCSIQSAEISNYFAGLRQDIEGAYYGFYFLEIAAHVTREENDESAMLGLLYQTLRALLNEHIPNRLVRCIYELRTLTIGGQAPHLGGCVVCGDREQGKMFSPKMGGLVCRECWDNVTDKIALDPSTIYSMQYIETSKIEKLYTFVVKENVLLELEDVTRKLMRIYMDYPFKSLEILETIL